MSPVGTPPEPPANPPRPPPGPPNPPAGRPPNPPTHPPPGKPLFEVDTPEGRRPFIPPSEGSPPDTESTQVPDNPDNPRGRPSLSLPQQATPLTSQQGHPPTRGSRPRSANRPRHCRPASSLRTGSHPTTRLIPAAHPISSSAPHPRTRPVAKKNKNNPNPSDQPDELPTTLSPEERTALHEEQHSSAKEGIDGAPEPPVDGPYADNPENPRGIPSNMTTGFPDSQATDSQKIQNPTPQRPPLSRQHGSPGHRLRTRVRRPEPQATRRSRSPDDPCVAPAPRPSGEYLPPDLAPLPYGPEIEDEEAIRTSLYLNFGNTGLAAQALGTAPGLLARTIERSPSLKADRDAARRMIVDAAEAAIVDALTDDSQDRRDDAARFVLTSLGKALGWGASATAPAGFSMSDGAGRTLSVRWQNDDLG